ncbi:MAG: polysaccharide biosynthesis/export family protein, partial [Candidatus Competibacter denitrificans]
MQIQLWMTILASSLLLSACADSFHPVEHWPSGFEAWRDDLPTYGFLPGDELDIKLIYNPEFSDRVIVAPDGYIHLALIGSVRALDRSPTELANELQQRYAAELRRPELTVVPRQFGSEIIYVGGEVQRPGVFKLTHRMGLLESIFQAGGFLDTARTTEVVVLRRNSNSKPMLKVVNVEQLIEGKAYKDNIPLQRFDLVYVPKSSVAEINLWINQNIERNLPFARTFNYTLNRNVTN